MRKKGIVQTLDIGPGTERMFPKFRSTDFNARLYYLVTRLNHVGMYHFIIFEAGSYTRKQLFIFSIKPENQTEKQLDTMRKFCNSLS